MTNPQGKHGRRGSRRDLPSSTVLTLRKKLRKHVLGQTSNIKFTQCIVPAPTSVYSVRRTFVPAPTSDKKVPSYASNATSCKLQRAPSLSNNRFAGILLKQHQKTSNKQSNNHTRKEKFGKQKEIMNEQPPKKTKKLKHIKHKHEQRNNETNKEQNKQTY